MSSAPNQFPKSSKSASSSHSQTEAQADSALEPSSPAETMTDQTANSVLMTPPTRMTSSGSTESEETSPTTTSHAAPETPASTVAPDAESSLSQTSQDQPSPPPETSAEAETPVAKVAPRNQPIPPASEPMQYRAIGLVRGRYIPSEEQFTRGMILTEDGVQIDAVLLGRVMSLVKKHIDLDAPHLWVVYPRTRDKELDLHMQIVGVWEPDKLNRSVSDEDAEDLETESEDAEETEIAVDAAAGSATVETGAAVEVEAEDSLSPTEDLDDCYFSVRGEVVFQSDEEERLLIKIRRAPKQGSTQAKAFKVALKGTLEGKGVGYFWDFQVQRENNDLVVKEATQIGMVPPQKRQGGSGERRGGPGGRFGGRPSGGRRGPGGPGGPSVPSGPPRKRWQDREGGSSPSPGGRPYRERSERSGDRPSQAPSAPRPPISKPIKRRPPTSEEE